VSLFASSVGPETWREGEARSEAYVAVVSGRVRLAQVARLRVTETDQTPVLTRVEIDRLDLGEDDVPWMGGSGGDTRRALAPPADGPGPSYPCSTPAGLPALIPRRLDARRWPSHPARTPAGFAMRPGDWYESRLASRECAAGHEVAAFQAYIMAHRRRGRHSRQLQQLVDDAGPFSEKDLLASSRVRAEALYPLQNLIRQLHDGPGWSIHRASGASTDSGSRRFYASSGRR